MQMTDDKGENSHEEPKRPRKPSKKKTKPSELDKSYRDKIEKAIRSNLGEYVKRRNLSQKQIAVMNSYLEEHLDCFVLIGYTATGEPITILNAPTQKDSDSLGTLTQKFMSKFIDPGSGPLPPQF